MRIAHLSDTHLLRLEGVSRQRLWLNKRFAGWVNLKLNRGHKHKHQVVEAMMDDLHNAKVDQVVVTGDVSNLALAEEFSFAKEVFARAGLPAERLTVVPGNHDVYTRGAQREQRFYEAFRPHMQCDLGLASDGLHPSGPFPFVQLRGSVALIGLSTAVARLPLFAHGYAGAPQLEMLSQVLEHPEVRSRTPVLLAHHPIINPHKPLARWMRGLAEAEGVRDVLQRSEGGPAVLLHGHLHERAHRVLEGPSKRRVDVLGATSASLLHEKLDRMAGYNVYEFGAGGLENAMARVWDPASRTFRERTIPVLSSEGTD